MEAEGTADGTRYGHVGPAPSGRAKIVRCQRMHERRGRDPAAEVMAANQAKLRRQLPSRAAVTVVASALMLLVHRISKPCRVAPLSIPAASFADAAGWSPENGKAPAFYSQNEGCKEPALRSGREAPASSGRRRRRAARRTRRSVSITPPKAGRGTECARPELSVSGACAALRQGSSPDGRRRDWLLMTGA
jgi:hypothetical protein